MGAHDLSGIACMFRPVQALELYASDKSGAAPASRSCAALNASPEQVHV